MFIWSIEIYVDCHLIDVQNERFIIRLAAELSIIVYSINFVIRVETNFVEEKYDAREPRTHICFIYKSFALNSRMIDFFFVYYPFINSNTSDRPLQIRKLLVVRPGILSHRNTE